MTLRTYFLQEVYEVIDAIEENDILNLKEELGDVLLQVVFHARIAEENGEFSMQDVVDGITNKMVKRHPFVFEKMSKEDLFAVIKNWEKRKRKEKNRKYLLSGIPKCLPSLLLACIIQKKVSSVGIYDLTAFREDEKRSGGMPLKERYRQGIEWGKKVQERTFLSLPVSCRKRELIRNFRYTLFV